MARSSTNRINLVAASLAVLLVLSACTVAKIEARLEANPQCKDIINPKTGALMPCPGTDKAFYAAAGLAPAKTVSTNAPANSNNPASIETSASANAGSSASAISTSNNSAVVTGATPAPVECKPKLHQKSGSLMPCPAP